MKRVIFVISIVLAFAFTSCATNQSTPESVGGDYPQPAFDKEYSVVIDAWSSGSQYRDFVRLINGSRNSFMNFYIYGYDGKTQDWLLLGTAMLKENGDTDTMGTSYKLYKFRYFAVQSMNELSFDVQVSVRRNDINLTIQ